MAQCMDADPMARPSAKEVVSLLSQPDVVLDHRLPPRRPKDKAKVCRCVSVPDSKSCTLQPCLREP